MLKIILGWELGNVVFNLGFVFCKEFSIDVLMYLFGKRILEKVLVKFFFIR